MSELARLTPILAEHFGRDNREEIPDDIWRNNRESAQNVLDNPDQFPRANREHLHTLLDLMDEFEAMHPSARCDKTLHASLFRI